MNKKRQLPTRRDQFERRLGRDSLRAVAVDDHLAEFLAEGGGALALGLHVGDEVVGLGEADALDAPVAVDEFLDELDLRGGGGLVVGELVDGDGLVDFAGFVGEEGAVEGDGDGAAAGGVFGGATKENQVVTMKPG